MVRDGYFYALGFLGAAIFLVTITGTWVWGLIPALLALFFLWFFRDPDRLAPQQAGLIVSPADGKLTEVARILTPEGERVRLSIFLSVFDVNVNRSPIAGTIREVKYCKGLHLNALNKESAAKNEHNLVTVQGDEFDVTFKQIAGVLARRIVFHPKVGDFVERGERIGLIKFGSRVDVILPDHAQIRVTPGQRVKGGSSVLAEISPAHSEPASELLVETLA
jgi:phosphatidylserine decarboxylase